MVNPLSRVAMKNILEKNKDKQDTRKISVKNNLNSDKTIDGLIKNVIHGEVKVEENNSINTAISLEEAAEIIKK